MAKKPAFFLLDPSDLEGINVQNAHVFDGFYDTETKKWTCSPPSRCGKVRIASAKPKNVVRTTDDREFCHAVVDGQERKFNACGMCMASFFADGE